PPPSAPTSEDANEPIAAVEAMITELGRLRSAPRIGRCRAPCLPAQAGRRFPDNRAPLASGSEAARRGAATRAAARPGRGRAQAQAAVMLAGPSGLRRVERGAMLDQIVTPETARELHGE